MKLPRISIHLLAYLVLVAGLDLAWVVDIVKQLAAGRSHSIFGLSWNILDMPILGLANVLAVSGYPLLVRRAGRPFLVGFVGGGLLCSAVYIVFFRTQYNLSRNITLFLRPIENWFGLAVYRLGDFRFVARYVTYLALVTLAGTLPLVALAGIFGLVTRLVAKERQISRVITAVIVAIPIGSTWMMLRRIDYQERATSWEEVSQLLSSEANDISKEIEKATTLGPAPGNRAGADLETMQRELAGRKSALATSRRQMEKYQRAASRPWRSVEE